MPRSRSYQEDLFDALKDPEEAKEYLNAALEDVNPEVFLLALKDVMEANKKVVRVVDKVNNENEVLSIQESSDD
jgi:DNA-binding phage protein